MKTDDQEQRLLEALRAVLEEFGNYGEPRVRGDGDIQIPLDIELKKVRARQSNLADAFSRMRARIWARSEARHGSSDLKKITPAGRSQRGPSSRIDNGRRIW